MYVFDISSVYFATKYTYIFGPHILDWLKSQDRMFLRTTFFTPAGGGGGIKGGQAAGSTENIGLQ